MKVIFLDIDGCLTSEREGTYFNSDPTKYHPSKKVMKQLMKLCDETGAKIVMATNWRKFDIDGEWVNKYGTYNKHAEKGVMSLVQHMNRQNLYNFLENSCSECSFCECYLSK